MQRIKLRKEPDLSAKLKAFTFQTEALSHIRDLEYAAIFHEQGLGKSKIAIDLILYWLKQKSIDTVLYVTKKSLVNNCLEEFKLHTHLHPNVLSQDKAHNFYVFNSPSRLIIANYEVIVSEYERIQLFFRSRGVAIILDESTRLKNPDSVLAKRLFTLAPLCKRRIIMSGTPIANRPYDIWAQVYFLDNGRSLGNDFKAFQKANDLTNELYKDQQAQDVFAASVESIFDKISGFTVRETKNSNIITLPEKIYENIEVEWERYQYDLYKQIKEETKAIIVKNGRPVLDDSEAILKRLLRLVQVASNPALIDQSYHKRPGKLDPLETIVTNIYNNNEKCIIWTSFTDNVDWLARELEKYGTRRLHGGISIQERNASIAAFKNNSDIHILVATPGAAKEGLTLTVANNVIFYDRAFSLDDYLQAQDRIHRISQEKTCHVYILTMQDSIDQWVDILLKSKHIAAQLAQGDISAEQFANIMTYDFGKMIKSVLGVNENDDG